MTFWSGSPTHLTQRPWRLLAEVGYVLAAAVLTAAGGLTQDSRYYLAAVVATLPLGLAAFVAVYVGYALIQGVGGLFASATTSDGSEAHWLAASSASLDVVLFVAAALGNILILRRIRSARRPV
jgi:hypothetical protein